MKKLIIGLVLLGFLLLASAYIYLRIERPNYSRNFYVTNTWGEGDETILAELSLSDYRETHPTENYQHRYLQLNHSDAWPVPAELLEGLAPEAPLVLTLECWGSKYWPNYRSNPLAFVREGFYDQKLQDLADLLAQEKRTVYLRFNPEMEVPGRFYPWQEYPSVFIEAYHRVHQIIKEKAPAVLMTWAPAGYPGCDEYYPGADFVDAISVNLIGPSEENLSVYPRYDAETELRRRLHRLRFFQHPTLVMSGIKEELPKQALANLQTYRAEASYLYQPVVADTNREKAGFKLGVYDPEEKLTGIASINTEHLFFNLTTFRKEGLVEDLHKIAQRGHDAILTLEINKDSSEGREERGLEKLLNGVYQPCLNDLWPVLQAFPNSLYLRFPQEMEIPIHRYPWQSKEPKLYIDAYRFFMRQADSVLERVYRVWGPAGDRGSLEWYPGSDVVDYISIAIYGLPDKNITDPSKQEQFEQIYRRKSWRMRHAPEPLFITEFGVKGPDAYQKDWLLKASKVIREAPNLVGVNYFNMQDVAGVWGDIDAPKWSVSEESYQAFCQALETKF